MLTDFELRALKPTGRMYKVADQRGLYVAVTSAGAVSFRFDYRLNGRRETLVIGRYDPALPARGARAADELSFGMSVRLAEARLLLERARREVEQGVSPSRRKVEKRVEAVEAMTFGKWAEKYFAEATLAESTRAMRKSVYDRNLAAEFGRLKLEEITPSRLLVRCTVLLSRRFDRAGGIRIPFLSAMSMTGSRDGQRGSYPELVDALTQHGAKARADAAQLYRRVAFNVLVSNVDDHLRNHGFLWTGHDGRELSPAYDLNPTPTDVKARILTTNIDLDEGTCSVGLLENAAEFF